MCGIIGIVGQEAAAPQLIDALKRLEYRGYDSAGVATLEHGVLTRRRAQGKLKNLEARLASEPLLGTIGIGHTRWATHGRPTENNAHPHATEKLAVVHNGIIENFVELRRELQAKGAKFVTETDTEVVAHLVSQEMERGASPVEAVKAALPRLRGAFALAFLFAGEDNLLIGARKGSPLAIGYGEGAMFVGSDAIALAPFTDTVSYLEDGDWVIITRAGAEVHDAQGAVVQRAMLKSQASVMHIDKGNHRHFMAKEIFEQPEVVGHTLANYIDMAAERVALPMPLPFDFAKLNRISIAACGTAYYAGMVAKYWFERFAHLPVEVDIASEYRYRSAPLGPGGLAIVVSQSGETADTLASLRYAREHRQHVLAIVNVPTSTIARESDVVMPTLAGPEIGVASTKAFTCQLAALATLAIAAGRARGVLVGERREEARPCADRSAAASCRGAGARATNHGARPRSRQMPRRALSRPRHQLPDRARRCAEAQGNLLHPRRGLCRRRAQARPDCADRRDHASDRDRALRPDFRKNRLEHGGGRRARRPADSLDRRARRARRQLKAVGDAHPADHAGDGDAAGLCRAGAAHRLSHRRHHGHRCRSAAQPCQVGDGGIVRCGSRRESTHKTAPNHHVPDLHDWIVRATRGAADTVHQNRPAVVRSRTRVKAMIGPGRATIER